MPSEARQKKIMEKLNRAKKCSILGPQNLGSGGARAPGAPPWIRTCISSRDMESIALGYLDIEEETIKNFRDARRDNMEAFNRDIIRHWVDKNPEPNQIEVSLTKLLVIIQARDRGGGRSRDPSRR